MTYPTLVPTERSFELGDWPAKKFRSMNGTEVRILYGTSETEAKLSLGYSNITDLQASEFVTHYRSLQGTYQRFALSQEVYSGWQGATTEGPDQVVRPRNARWRYESPPRISSVRPGVSSVQVSLIAVL